MATSRVISLHLGPSHTRPPVSPWRCITRCRVTPARARITQLRSSTPASLRRCRHVHIRALVAEVDAEADAPLRADIAVKLGVAASTDKLDLTDCELTHLPRQMLMLPELVELSAAGNQLEALPAAMGSMEHLQRIGLAGNRLQSLPDTLCNLQQLQGLWVHGNRLQQLPPNIGQLSCLHTLSLSSNQLAQLPRSITQLTSLQELGLAGNRLTALPAGMGALQQLKKLALNGNQLEALPEGGLAGCSALQELMLMGNRLSSIGTELAGLQAVEELSLADNELQRVDDAAFDGLVSLKKLHLFGNQLRGVPLRALEALPQLHSLWLEGNPLEPAFVSQLLASLPNMTALKSLGLDMGQLEGVDPALVQSALGSGVLRLGEVLGSGQGYFKLQLAAAPQYSSGGQSWTVQRAPVLVVAFGSAPGTPNWGGLLARLARTAGQHQQRYDVLYVVDPARAWYSGGDDGLAYWAERLRRYTCQYSHVVMLGDSMGATASLLFCEQATSVLAFCPQVDLATASIRPAQSDEWFATLKGRLLAATSKTGAKVRVLTGTWQHDLDQANMLPRPPKGPAAGKGQDPAAKGVFVDVQPVGTHRLALAMDKQGKLLKLVQAAALAELGLQPPPVRLANLL